MPESKEFVVRFYQEYRLRFSVKMVAWIALILCPLFVGLDIFIAPEQWVLILWIRSGMVIACLVVLAAISFTTSHKGLLRLGVLLMISLSLGIATMVQLLGGFMSSYYQGFTIILVGMLTVLPWGLRESLVVSGFVFLSYIVPSLFFQTNPAIDNQVIINNLFFLTSIIVIVLVASYLLYGIRSRALHNLIQLETVAHALEETNQKLTSLDRIKTDFFANVSHELRTPLTLMLAPLGPLKDGLMGDLPQKAQEIILSMRRNGLRLLKQINNLLDFTKLEEGKLRLKLESIDPSLRLQTLLGAISSLAESRNLNLSFESQLQEKNLVVDPEQFEKVMLNLLSNAIKFTPEGGHITLRGFEDEQKVVIEVEDTGIGIPENMHQKVFERFSQVNSTLSRQHEGTGIGLALAKEIVDLHAGKISLRSEPGKGSVFITEWLKGEGHFGENIKDRRRKNLPVPDKKRKSDHEEVRISDIITNSTELQLADLEQTRKTTEARAKCKAHEHSLLVIDDNPDILHLFQSLLQEKYDLVLCQSAEEGLSKLHHQMQDLVICDVMMPKMNGHQFCQKVKASEDLKQIPIILVTARAESEMLVEGIDAGADDYLAKPFDPAELHARVRSLLRMRDIEAQLAQANRNLRIRAEDLLGRQKDLFLATVKSLVSALDAKDQYTRNHSLRVTEYSLAIAKRLGFSERELRDLELACLLHDVGKIGVPETVLNKPDKLSEEEFILMKAHPVKGESILKPITELRQIASIVRSHHERYDGQGYPDGIIKLDIPIGARIMAVGDTYDAITSDRPYRNGLSHHFAVKEIIRCSGTQFDPEIVEHFLDLADSFRNQIANASPDISL